MDDNQQQLVAIQNEITHVQSAYSNMMNFDAWDWGAYKVEAHEKDEERRNYMTIQSYVTEVLRVPVSRIGNIQVVEAIELYLDEKNHKFLPRLSEVTGKTVSALDNSLREAKRLSLLNMDEKIKEKIFSEYGESITITQFIIASAHYYKEMYENKEER